MYVLNQHCIAEDYIPIQPENSEAHRRIGAKGTNSVLHVSPYGVTLALQVCLEAVYFDKFLCHSKVNLVRHCMQLCMHFLIGFHITRFK